MTYFVGILVGALSHYIIIILTLQKGYIDIVADLIAFKVIICTIKVWEYLSNTLLVKSLILINFNR